MYLDWLLAGVAAGHCNMSDVDTALYNTLRVCLLLRFLYGVLCTNSLIMFFFLLCYGVAPLQLRFELGLFDPIEDQPYWHVPPSAVNTPESQALNLLATRQSMVLLKNDAHTLPFKANSVRDELLWIYYVTRN